MSTTYAAAIALAILEDPRGALPVSAVYNFFERHREQLPMLATRTWRHRVRKVLSSSSYFDKNKSPSGSGPCHWSVSDVNMPSHILTSAKALHHRLVCRGRREEREKEGDKKKAQRLLKKKRSRPCPAPSLLPVGAGLGCRARAPPLPAGREKWRKPSLLGKKTQGTER